MPPSLSVSDARSLLRSRDQLLDLGHSERGIRTRVAAGDFVRVRRGHYVGGEVWRRLWMEERHLLHVVAVNQDAVVPPIFVGVSAAVLHGLPLYRTSPARVHTAARRGASRSMPDVLRHEMPLDHTDVVEVQGIRCTTLDRTVLDVAGRLTPEAAVACADAALRSVAVTGHVQDETRAGEWRARLLGEAAVSRSRGIRQARRVLSFADGRAQLPGESVSRLQLHRIGFRGVGVQTPVILPDGSLCVIDFDLEEAGAFGELDGRGKYLDEEMRAGRSAEEVLLAEKRREDEIRGVTGRRIVRWSTEDIRTPMILARRLEAFGVRPREGWR